MLIQKRVYVGVIKLMKFGMESHGLWELGWLVLAEGWEKRHVEWKVRFQMREGLDGQPLAPRHRGSLAGTRLRSQRAKDCQAV